MTECSLGEPGLENEALRLGVCPAGPKRDTQCRRHGGLTSRAGPLLGQGSDITR